MSNTIIFAGGEMGAFVPSDSTVVEGTSVASYDPAYARCSLGLQGAPGTFAKSSLFSSQTDFWFHAEVFAQISSSALNPIIFVDNSGNNVFSLRMATNTIQMQYWNGSAWVSIGASAYVSYSSRATIDLHVVLGSSGSATLYSSGTLMSSGSANIPGANVSQLVLLGVVNSFWTAIYWSQIIIATQSTISYKLSTVPIIGNGSVDQWNGTYTDINETVYRDSTYISANTASLTSNFTQNTTVSGEIIAVVVSARASCGLSGPQNIQMELNLGGSEYLSNSISLGTDLRAMENIWNTNPNTAAAWQASDLTTLKYGVKSIT